MTFLKNTWYVAAWSREVEPGKLLQRKLLNEYYVLFRDPDNHPRVLLDRCPHRFAPLSMGKLCHETGVIECPYHGLQFSSAGVCVHNPHGDGRIPARALAPVLPVIERHSALWVWMGDPDKADPGLIPGFDFLDPDSHAVACDRITINAHYELESDNILDLSHIEYLHPLFSTPAVSQGEYECVVEGDTVWSKRSIANDELTPFLSGAFGLEAGKRADRWLNARWNAPACMALWTGGVESGQPASAGREVVGAHIFTPETENRSHYFFSSSFPWTIGAEAQQMAEESISAATGPEGVFTTEDKPMLEAQAENMAGREFWSMKPIVLSIDAAAVQARRILAKKIQQEAQPQSET